MTDIPDLASLTIKDLRQLAGEHNIQHRSRLGKDELIQALTEVLASRGSQLAHASPAAAAADGDSVDGEDADGVDEGEEVPEAPAAVAHDAAEDVGDDDVADADDAEEDEATAVRPSLAPASATEPEEITAESVAGLAQPSRPAPRDGGQRQQEWADGPGPQGQPGQPGEPGRRRRRRRRRGRGRGRDGEQGGFGGQPTQGGAGHHQGGQPLRHPGGIPDEDDAEGDADEPLDAEGAAPDAQAEPDELTVPSSARPSPGPRPGPGGGAPQQQARPAPAHAAPGAMRHEHARHDQRAEHRQDPRHEGHRHDQRPESHRQEARPEHRHDPRHEGHRHDVRQDGQRPPRPRLDGPMRSVPSVLDRLCSFSRGILELCSPDTPSWAQPRLSELLAEAGMVPVPTQGTPHPDFHEVVGTMPQAQVPPGHIAQLVAPGFALRGDRGDLFPLRKAKVRIAEGGRPTPPTPPERTDPEGHDDVDTEEGPEALVAEVTAADPAPHREPADEPSAPEVDPAPPAPSEDTPADSMVRPAPLAAPGPRPGPPNGHHAPTAGVPRPLDRNQPRPAARPPAPPQGRPALRTHPREPATVAPGLPLAMQVPDELAARAKADGFRALGLNDQILADLAAIGYQSPTPIQSEAIPVVLSGKDMIGQAQTGTGKTAAFTLPILQALYRVQGQGPVALVLCPTRELARQVHHEFTRMAGASGARAALIYGGVPMDDQVRALERQPHVVIGTPGRIIDHMRRRTLDLSRLQVAVLDEADQMLDIGFWPDVNFIISHSPPNRQMLLFSATFPDPIRQLAQKHMREPVHVRIQPAQVTVEQVDQKYIAVAREKKNDLLAHFIETQQPPQLVVFCKTKHQTDRVAEVLKRKHMSAAAIHGDLPQSKREKTLAAFRSGDLQCLIATNVAARGLDIPTVSHVVNYDIPEAPEEYVHRIGRTARNGARGVARTFITPEDGQFLVEIEKHIGLLLEEERIEGFSASTEAPEVKRAIADMPVGTPRLLKPLVGGIRLGRRR